MGQIWLTMHELFSWNYTFIYFFMFYVKKKEKEKREDLFVLHNGKF